MAKRRGGEGREKKWVLEPCQEIKTRAKREIREREREKSENDRER